MTGGPSTEDELLSLYTEHELTDPSDVYEDDRKVRGVAPAARRPQQFTLFDDPEAHPQVIDKVLLRAYGPEWLSWEPEILDGQVHRDFGVGIHPSNRDKLQAIKTLHLVDSFWQQWTVFLPCATALSGLPADFRVMSALTVPQLLIAVDIASHLRGSLEYSEEIKRFMEAVFLHDGMLVAIPPVDSLVTLDPSRYMVDTAAVSRAWPTVRATGKVPEGHTAEGVQLTRMLEAHGILEANRKQRDDQMRLTYD